MPPASLPELDHAGAAQAVEVDPSALAEVHAELAQPARRDPYARWAGDLWQTPEEIAAARLVLAWLDQRAREPGLAKFMIPLDPKLPPCRSGSCSACGMGVDTARRWGHATAQHAAGRLRCVRWALGIPEATR